MPKTKARCYKTVYGIPIPPADGLLCPNCRFLLKHGQTGHYQSRSCAYACDPDKKVSDAGAAPSQEASPVGRQLRQDPARTQVLSASSTLRDMRTGQRKVARWRLAAPQPAAVQRHPDQPVHITFAQLAGFEFMARPDGTELEGELQLFEFQQFALVEHLLGLGVNARKVNNQHIFGDEILRWLRDSLLLSGDAGARRFAVFKRQTVGSVRLPFLVRRVRTALNLPESKTILRYLYWEAFQARDCARKRAVWVDQGEEVVRSKTLARLRNYEAKATTALEKSGASAPLDLEEVCFGFRKTRCSFRGDFGWARKYIMAEILAVCPYIGNETMAEVAMLFNLLCLYSLTAHATGDDPGLDATEMRYLSEAATHLTPSPDVWQEVPLQLLALTVERAAAIVRKMEIWPCRLPQSPSAGERRCDGWDGGDAKAQGSTG
jgi:hypothetical protein